MLKRRVKTFEQSPQKSDNHVNNNNQCSASACKYGNSKNRSLNKIYILFTSCMQ